MFTTQQKSYLALGIICFVWGTTCVISKLALQHVSVVQLCGMRQLLAGITMILFFTVRGFRLPAKKDWPRLVLMSMLMFVMANGMSTWGISYIESGLGAIIGSSTAFWIPVFALLVLKQNVFNAKIMVGLTAGITGIVVIFSEKLGRFNNSSFIWGILLSLTATIAWSLATVLSMKKKDSARLYAETGWQMALSALVFLPLAVIMDLWTPLHEIPAKTWGLFAYLTIAGSLLTFISYVYAIKHLPPALLSIYAYINPIVAILFGWILLREPISITLAIGGAITLTGVYLVNEGSKKRKQEPNG
jgi:drug/metabolite transporter (DMT)-like permease